MKDDAIAAPQRRVLRVPALLAGQRLDVALAHAFPDLSRSFLQKLIAEGRVRVDGRPAKAGQRVRVGSEVVVEIPPPEPTELVPEPIPLTVVYEDEDLLVVDKPAGMVVHPAPGHPRGTLVNAILARHPEIHIGGTVRPGIVHRLDRDTSGLILVAKNERALVNLQAQLKNRQIEKEYIALVHGRLPQKEGVIEAPIGRDPRDRTKMAVVPGGRPAVTRYRVLEELPTFTLVAAYPVTGRTHQIRVHFAWIGHPVVGDQVYGRDRTGLRRQFLHAARLKFRHPRTGEWIEVRSPLPAELQGFLNNRRREAQRAARLAAAASGEPTPASPASSATGERA